MPNPLVPGGVTVTKTPEEIAAEEAAKAAEEAKRKEEEEKAKAEEEAKRKAAEEGNKEDEEKPKTVIITTDEGDVTYDLDDEGNAVKDGQIVYTKEQLDELEDPKDVTLADVSALSGLTPLNNDGTPKEYEMTVEGLAQRDADIAAIAASRASASAIDEFFKVNPDIYQALVYKRTYGSLEGFANHVDWSTMTLDGKTDEQLKSIIRSAEKRKGTSDAQIERMIRFSEADKVLDEVARESLEYLAKAQQREIDEANAKQEAIEAEQQAKLDAAYGITYDEDGKMKVLNVKDSLYDKIVNQGVISGLRIPTSGVKHTVDGKEVILSRRDLVRYLTEPSVEVNGNFYTRAQQDVIKMLSNDDMFAILAIKNLLGADAAQLAEATVKAENVRRLHIASNKGTIKPSTGVKGKINPNRKPVVPGGIIDSH